MTTDIILDAQDGNTLKLSASVIHSEASDFILDSKGRRKSREHLRRALVHDVEDGLTINFDNDYPGGVTINSVTRISPKPQFVGIKGARGIGRGQQLPGGIILPLEPPEIIVSNDLVIDGGISFLWDNGSVGEKAGRPTEQKSLQSLIAELQGKIASLESRVVALGG